MNKVDIVNQIIEEQKKHIGDLVEAISIYESTADIDEDNTLDPEDFSHQSEAKEMQLRHEQRLQGEKDKLHFLKTYATVATNKAELGALLETEEHYIFIGFSMPPFSIEDKEVICLSEKAPITSDIMGKKTGDTITIGADSYEILKVY